MKIKDFGVEMWMNAYENDCTYNLAETCVESLTVEQLLELGGCREQAVADILGMKLTYGAIEAARACGCSLPDCMKNRHRRMLLRRTGLSVRIIL